MVYLAHKPNSSNFGTSYRRKAMNSFSSDPQFRAKLDALTENARSANLGDTHFLQVKFCPVISLILETGEMKEDPQEGREIHMRVIDQPDHYPEAINDIVGIHRHGYSLYMRKLHDAYEADNSIGFDPISLQEWKRRILSITDVIDATIYQNHGIKCYEDGNSRNNHISNVIYIHVCDILNLYMTGLKNLPSPRVVVVTQLLERFPEGMVDILTTDLLDTQKLNLLVEHIDFFYMFYAYYGNFSFIPIRSRLHCRLMDQMPHSSMFMNDEHFIRHQNGKMKQLNIDNPMMQTVAYYRSR
jgi:hypothetical protein